MPRVRRCRYPGCHAMVKLPDHYCREHYEHEAEYLAKRGQGRMANHISASTTHRPGVVMILSPLNTTSTALSIGNHCDMKCWIVITTYASTVDDLTARQSTILCQSSMTSR